MKFVRRFFSVIGILAVVLLILTRVVHFADRSSTSDDNVLSKLTKYHDKIRFLSYETQDAIIRYADLGSDELQPVMLLHGSPGSMTTFMTMVKDTDFTERYRLIIPDRVGRGRSTSE